MRAVLAVAVGLEDVGPGVIEDVVADGKEQAEVKARNSASLMRAEASISMPSTPSAASAGPRRSALKWGHRRMSARAATRWPCSGPMNPPSWCVECPIEQTGSVEPGRELDTNSAFPICSGPPLRPGTGRTNRVGAIGLEPMTSRM